MVFQPKPFLGTCLHEHFGLSFRCASPGTPSGYDPRCTGIRDLHFSERSLKSRGPKSNQHEKSVWCVSIVEPEFKGAFVGSTNQEAHGAVFYSQSPCYSGGNEYGFRYNYNTGDLQFYMLKNANCQSGLPLWQSVCRSQNDPYSPPYDQELTYAVAQSVS